MDSRVTKTNGLIEALKMHDLSLDELCVFGDADNDYDMVKNAAMGVVMAMVVKNEECSELYYRR